jgi:hypothetical protein
MPAIMPNYRVYVRGSDYRRHAELFDWEHLQLKIRFNEVGTWALRMNRSSPEAALMVRQAGIIVTRDDETIFSGQASTEWTRTGTTLSVAGVDDMAILETPARPVPAQATGPYATQFDTRTGVASTIMTAFVSDQVGTTAPFGWRIGAMNMTADPALGSSGTFQAEWGKPLIEVLGPFAASPVAGGLRFVVLQNDLIPNTITFKVMDVADLTHVAKFSIALDTVKDFEDTWKFPGANYVMVAGGDALGVDRTVVEGSNSTSVAEVGRRIVQWIDARHLTTVAQLNQRRDEALATLVTSRQVKVTPFNNQSLVFGVHYDIGDLVTFVLDDEVFNDVIREVTLTLDPEGGATAVPMLGNTGTSSDDRLVQHMKTVAARVNRLERYYAMPDGAILAPMLGTGAVGSTALASGAAAANLGSGSVSSSMLAAGAAVSNIGYTPARVSASSYTGDNAATRTISVGFTPIWVQVTSPGNSATLYLGDGTRLVLEASGDVIAGQSGGFVAGGFTARHDGNSNNASGVTYYYTAIG